MQGCLIFHVRSVLNGDSFDHADDLRLQFFRIWQCRISTHFTLIKRHFAVKGDFEHSSLAGRERYRYVRPTGRIKFASHPESHGVVASRHAVFNFSPDFRRYFRHIYLHTNDLSIRKRSSVYPHFQRVGASSWSELQRRTQACLQRLP